MNTIDLVDNALFWLKRIKPSRDTERALFFLEQAKQEVEDYESDNVGC